MRLVTRSVQVPVNLVKVRLMVLANRSAVAGGLWQLVGGQGPWIAAG